MAGGGGAAAAAADSAASVLGQPGRRSGCACGDGAGGWLGRLAIALALAGLLPARRPDVLVDGGRALAGDVRGAAGD